MPLAKIERAFVGILLQQQVSEPDFLSELLPVGSLSEEKQLSIYRSNVNGAHQKVLAQIYPACLNILGKDYFNQLCRSYRFEYPSTDSDLNNYGEYFSSFINEQVEIHDELNGFEYLAELALLEWHWHANYYVKDDEPFSFEKLGLVEPGDHNKLVFTLSDSFTLFSTFYPLLDIWEANKNSADARQEFSMPETESYFCMSRVNFHPEIELLNNYQYELLKAIIGVAPLTQLSALEVDSDAEYLNDFQNEIMSFIQKGWVCNFSLQDLFDV